MRYRVARVGTEHRCRARRNRTGSDAARARVWMRDDRLADIARRRRTGPAGLIPGIARAPAPIAAEGMIGITAGRRDHRSHHRHPWADVLRRFHAAPVATTATTARRRLRYCRRGQPRRRIGGRRRADLVGLQVPARQLAEAAARQIRRRRGRHHRRGRDGDRRRRLGDGRRGDAGPAVDCGKSGCGGLSTVCPPPE